VLAVDVLTKYMAERQLETPLEVVFGARLALSHNSGMAFGVAAGAPDALVVAGVAICLATLVVAIARGWLPASALALGLLGGGAAANLLDRAPDGRVTDFIALPHWPSFNVADIAITLAMLALIVTSARTERAATSMKPTP